MGKTRMIWNQNMDRIVLDLWSENFDELIEHRSKRNEQIYREMAANFNQKYPMKVISKWDLRVKINNLTQRYRQERKLVTASGIESSTWPYYEKIHQIFTREYQQNTTNTDLFDTINLNEIKNEEDDLLFQIFDDKKIPIDEYKQIPTCILAEHKTKLPLSSEKIRLRSAKKIKIYEKPNIFKKIDSKKDLNGATENDNNEKPYDQFGKYVASELRQLPIREAILLQQELQNSIIRVKLSCLEYLSSNNNYHFKVQNNIRSSSTSS